MAINEQQQFLLNDCGADDISIKMLITILGAAASNGVEATGLTANESGNYLKADVIAYLSTI